jgi:hypothetical protein
VTLQWQSIAPLQACPLAAGCWLLAAGCRQRLAPELSEQLLGLVNSFAGFQGHEKVERIFAWMRDNIAFSGIRRMRCRLVTVIAPSTCCWLENF